MDDLALLPGLTLDEAKAWHESRLEEGVTCLCCGRHDQTYPWTMYSTAARALALFYRLAGHNTTEYVQYRDLMDLGHKGQSDQARLRWWDLLERHPDKRGLWRVTPHGEAFLHGRVAVPKIWVHLGEVVRVEHENTKTFAEAIGTPFDLDEVLGTARKQIA